MRRVRAGPGTAATLLMALLAGCGGEPRSPAAQGENLAVVMRWPGDDFADGGMLETRDRVASLIEEEGVGKVLARGTGMGTAEVVFAPVDGGGLRERVRELMGREAPGVSWTIESRPPLPAGSGKEGTLQTGVHSSQ